MVPFSIRKLRNSMMKYPFPGTVAEPDDYRLFTLKNAGDMAVTVSERGGVLRSWRTPDRYGRMADVLLAGRGGAATLWQGQQTGGGVAMRLTAPAGAPGPLVEHRLDYRLDDDGNLTIDYHATARSTARLEANPHTCFNLNGGAADVGDHILQIDADYYVEVDAEGTPSGVAAVGGTPFDFRQPAPIGPRLSWPDRQLHLARGFDHCLFVRSHYAGGQGPLRQVARVVDPGSGRCLQMYTTEAAVQLCAGTRVPGPGQNQMPGHGLGPGGFCLDSTARPGLTSAGWPHVMLHPGKPYRQTTVYRLSLEA